MSILNISESNALLLYRVGPILVCSPTMPVEAVVVPPKITVPPGASVAEPGVFRSIHGMVRLVDLRVRFGVDEKDYASPGKIIIVEVEGGHAGFWVDEIEDVVSFPGAGWSQVPAYIPKHVFSKTLVQNNTIRLYADFEQLDKFKAAGYLRRHIEILKASEKSTDDNKTANLGSDKSDEILNVENKQPETKITKNKDINSEVSLTNVSKKEISKKIAAPIKPKISSSQVCSSSSKTSENSGIKPPEIKTGNAASQVSVSSIKSGGEEKSKPIFSPGIKKESNGNDAVTEKEIRKPDFILNDSDSDFKTDPVYGGANNAEKINEVKYAVSGDEPEVLHNVKPEKKHNAGGVVTKVFLIVIAIFVFYAIYGLVWNEPHKNETRKDFSRSHYKNNDKDVISNSAIKSEPVDEEVDHDVVLDKSDDYKKIIPEKKPGEVEIIKSDNGVLIVINDVDFDVNQLQADVSVDADNEVAEKHKTIKTEDDFEKSNDSTANKEIFESVIDAEVPKKVSEKEETNEEPGKNKSQITSDAVPEVKTGVAVDKASDEINDKIKSNASASYVGSVEGDDYPKKSEIPESKKYVHIVVKGDTLWHIAKRYVHNPWRYPELAKLSKIKNPDLIYPGDRVTIIINYRK